MTLAGSAADDVQALFDRGTAAAAAGRHQEAVQILYEGLQALRAAGEGETPDAGLFAGEIARSLAALGDPQADDAYRLAVALLSRSADPVPFVAAARDFANRLIAAGQKDEAVKVAEALLARTDRGDAGDLLKARAIETAIGAYGAAGRNADADRVLTKAAALAGDDPFIAYLRGMARMQIAREAQKSGRMVELAAALDGALADLRLSGEDGRSLLGPLLLMRGRMAFNDGDYRKALPAIEEAVPLLEADATEEDDWIEALALRGRLLERLDRVREAIASADAAVAAFEKRKGAGSTVAVAERLDRIEFLVRAGRGEEARRALADESDRLGAKADPVIAGFFFERLAAIDKADGAYGDAVDAAERAIEIRREAFPDVPSLLLEPMRIRADASIGLADLDYSERAHRELIALSESIYPRNHPEIARDLNSFASLLASFRRYDEAEAIERRSAAILKVAYGETGAKYGFALHNLATFIMFNGKAEEAVDLFGQSIAIADRLPDEADFQALARFNRASALLQLGRFGDALAEAEESERRHRQLPALAQRRLSSVYGLEMQALAGLGRTEEALAAGRRMIATAGRTTYEDAANIAIGMTKLAEILVRHGPPGEALTAARDALALTQSLSLGGSGTYREVSGTLVDAAWRAGSEVGAGAAAR
jgi:tetratricopeptide (TPR) repeat protein